MVPINTKNKPRAKERATIVIVLGEGILTAALTRQDIPTELNESSLDYFPV